jgi:hypothetical protein
MSSDSASSGSGTEGSTDVEDNAPVVEAGKASHGKKPSKTIATKKRAQKTRSKPKGPDTFQYLETDEKGRRIYKGPLGGNFYLLEKEDGSKRRIYPSSKKTKNNKDVETTEEAAPETKKRKRSDSKSSSGSGSSTQALSNSSGSSGSEHKKRKTK